ncbi:hypothetical protein [Streptomyces sp. NPDC005494]|uniref:hypothetical protein n=1 Tax=Streptomyces sp. NPDC005494 TaxID=3364715 RepID=UPI003677D64B
MEDPYSKVLRECSETGSISGLVELALTQDAKFIVNTVESLRARGWRRFAQQLLTELATQHEVRKVPSIAAELKVADYDDHARGMLTGFGGRRTPGEVADLVELLMRAGARDYADVVLSTAKERRPARDVAQLLSVLTQRERPWAVATGSSTHSERWCRSHEFVADIFLEFDRMGFRDGVSLFRTHVGEVGGQPDILELCEALKVRGLGRERESCLTWAGVFSIKYVQQAFRDERISKEDFEVVVRSAVAESSERSLRYLVNGMGEEVATAVRDIISTYGLTPGLGATELEVTFGLVADTSDT